MVVPGPLVVHLTCRITAEVADPPVPLEDAETALLPVTR
jgi:hypothetical protein